LLNNGDAGISFALARYRADGGLDPTFGAGGKLISNPFNQTSSSAAGLALQPDHKIVAAGFTVSPSATPDFALTRYDPNGAIDSSFGNGGKVVTDFGAREQAFGLTLQSDGKIVATGMSSGEHMVNKIVLARYDGGAQFDICHSRRQQWESPSNQLQQAITFSTAALVSHLAERAL